ncbi:alpha/beta hydrolase [Streptomyces sp. NPDC127051]|uniref:alpha/beta hydrolase n=1 Tax=Streptomyces sp. NPDC127051 TaxID=3347119 RepID=UPI00366915B1
MPPSRRPTLLFIHGAWMTSECWGPFRGFFEERGHRTIAPAWPGKEGGPDAVRGNPRPLAGLGGKQIIDHYARIIEKLPEPPVLVGHSFGGLFVQVLLDRGLGAAGVAINSAAPRGVLVTQPSALRAVAPVLANPRNRSWTVPMSPRRFHRHFAHTLPKVEARAAHARHVTPETGRIFFEAGLAGLTRPAESPFTIDYAKPDRAPLLLMAGGKDRIAPASLSRANHRRYRSGVVDFAEFPDRTHWTIAEEGWETVALRISRWLDGHG